MNRRDFLRLFAAGALTVKAGSVDTFWENDAIWANDAVASALSDVSLNPDLVAIFSDIHLIEPDSSQQASRFSTCVSKILAMNPRPATLLIYGDIANSKGDVADYAIFRRLIKPIERAGIRWEIALGNHDRIENYQTIFPERFPQKSFVENRYINIVETPRADFILLDSYLKGEVRGAIDSAQKDWLVETLKKYDDKPVFVGCHHPLKETELGETLRACPKCAGYLYGHNHWWKVGDDKGLPTICFPSTGHWGDLGFALLTLTEEKATFAPSVDQYLMPTWSDKEPVADVDAYLKALAEKIAVVPLP